jgi:hypothetical protein
MEKSDKDGSKVLASITAKEKTNITEYNCSKFSHNKNQNMPSLTVLNCKDKLAETLTGNRLAALGRM